ASNSKPRQVNLSNIIRTLVINSLAHYDSMLRLLTVDQDYARTEGFMGTEYYQEEIIKKAFGLKQTGISKWA
ncbi:MAG TPA: hypothetical protein VHZ30_07885, partial [Verrucomicrobiae bacterium]|nr:hypothetical protein [Verrucomicrobiae bacterium]